MLYISLKITCKVEILSNIFFHNNTISNIVVIFPELPMNKIQVGAAPSPNIKQVRSKIGSLENATYKPGGGNVKIENRKLEWKAAPKIEALNEKYVPGGGDKKASKDAQQLGSQSSDCIHLDVSRELQAPEECEN